MSHALSAPVSRKPLHTRTVKCNGYKRDDALYDIEGHLVDVKSVGFYNMDRGDLKPGEPIHEMWIRLTVDLNLKVVDVEAKTVWGPYTMCGDITPNFQRLKGLSIGQGWTRKTRELLGGTQGCTHLVELLGPVATTAFQTVYADKTRREKQTGTKVKPVQIDSCHAYASDSPVVKHRHPEYYTGPRKEAAS